MSKLCIRRVLASTDDSMLKAPEQQDIDQSVQQSLLTIEAVAAAADKGYADHSMNINAVHCLGE